MKGFVRVFLCFVRNSWPWDQHLKLAGKLTAFMWFWTHWSGKGYSPDSECEICSVPSSEAGLPWSRSLFISNRNCQFCFEKSKSKLRLPDSRSGRLFYVWPQIGCYLGFCNTWCLVLHQMMDAWFCWFLPDQGICLSCGRPIWWQDWTKALTSDLCCITWAGCWVVFELTTARSSPVWECHQYWEKWR